jgi:hypothetical protein
MAPQTIRSFQRIILVGKVVGKNLRRIWNGHTAKNTEETWIHVPQIRDQP